jgi:flagellar L-ring protein precursor FlgH
MKAYLTGCAFVLGVLLQHACTPLPQRDPAFATVPPSDIQAPVQSNGAIYQAGYDMRLFEDNKARRIGDILTIRLDEQTQAKKKSALDSNKNNDITVSAPTLWGVASSTIFGHDVETNLKAEKKFEGDGQANQSNSLTGDITVTVVDVLPNGNLKVRGEKRMTLNQGDEYIRLSGIVRPVDISSGNIISSDKVADPTIMYTGNGAMADASKMGWLSRILFSPWFPF